MLFGGPSIAHAVDIVYTVWHTGRGQLGLEVLDMGIDKVEAVHDIGQLATKMFGYGGLGKYAVLVGYKEQQQFVFRFGKDYFLTIYSNVLVRQVYPYGSGGKNVVGSELSAPDYGIDAHAEFGRDETA